MLGMIFGGLTTASTRIAVTAFTIAVWLISRPGGWAVLVFLALLALRWFPEAAPVPAP
jgi:hypothetical protein